MKEFEKWLKGKAGIDWYTGAEEGWRAALELVQSSLKFGSEVAYSEADILMAIKKEIREELDK